MKCTGIILGADLFVIDTIFAIIHKCCKKKTNSAKEKTDSSKTKKKNKGRKDLGVKIDKKMAINVT